MQLVSTAGLVPTSARSLASFRLYRPESVAGAIAALRDAEDPVLLAGGTDLVAAFNEGLCPREVVSLARVGQLQRIDTDGQFLRIGAAVTHHAGCTSPLVRARAPGFDRAWARIANPRIRFGATLGGNLMARRRRYEGSILLAAIGARLELTTGEAGVRLTPQDLWEGCAPARALLTAITIDTTGLIWFDYERSMRPLMTFATCLRRRADGLALTCAVATEYLRPALLELTLPGTDTASVVGNARAIAGDAFAQLQADFCDPVLTRAYAAAAGTALLSRQLAGVAHG